MSQSLVNKLLESFEELDRCIMVTEDVLSQREGVPEYVVGRVNQYREIVAKQRGLALDLKQHLGELGRGRQPRQAD